MGELIDLTLLRRAYRILDHFIGDQLELPPKTLRKSESTSSTRRSPGAPIGSSGAGGRPRQPNAGRCGVTYRAS